MLCFLLLRLGSMSASSGRGRQHAFLKQKAQRTIRGASRRRAYCVLNATLFAALHMSAFGTKRTFQRVQSMSAFGGKADIDGTCFDVCF